MPVSVAGDAYEFSRLILFHLSLFRTQQSVVQDHPLQRHCCQAVEHQDRQAIQEPINTLSADCLYSQICVVVVVVFVLFLFMSMVNNHFVPNNLVRFIDTTPL
jgi:hypothetical protein